MPEERSAAIAASFDAYVVKPFDRDELTSVVSALLAKNAWNFRNMALAHTSRSLARRAVLCESPTSPQVATEPNET
jgi:DNA-binding response OmpR family regulator